MRKLLTLILAGLMAAALTGCNASDPGANSADPTTESPAPTSNATAPIEGSNPDVKFYADYSNIPDFGVYAGISCSEETTSDSTKYYIYKYADIVNAIANNGNLLPNYYSLLVDGGFSPFDVGDEELSELGVVCYVGTCNDEVVSIVMGPIDVGEYAVVITADSDLDDYVQQNPEPTVEITDTSGVGNTQDDDPSMSLDALCVAIESVLDKNYSGIDVTQDGESITVNLWVDGLCMELTLAEQSGNDNYKETWETAKANTVSLAKSICDLVDTSGYTDVFVTLNVLNDLNHDNVLLSIFEGIVIFDVMAQ